MNRLTGPRRGTHPGALLLGVQQGEVVGGRQAGGGQDISQGHSGFSQKPGGEEQSGSQQGKGPTSRGWCKPRHQQPTWGARRGGHARQHPRLAAALGERERATCDSDPARGKHLWGLCPLFIKEKHLKAHAEEPGAINRSADGFFFASGEERHKGLGVSLEMGEIIAGSRGWCLCATIIQEDFKPP